MALPSTDKRTLERWQLDVLEQERRHADRERRDRELAIGDWAFAADISERG